MLQIEKSLAVSVAQFRVSNYQNLQDYKRLEALCNMIPKIKSLTWYIVQEMTSVTASPNSNTCATFLKFCDYYSI
jgi:hypothetical protein